MRSVWIKAVLATGLMACWAGTGWAALSAGEKLAAEMLVRQLTDPEFKARESAVQGLVALGPDVVPMIKPLLTSDDKELKLRAQMVLDGVAAKFPDAAGVAGAAPVAVRLGKDLESLIKLKIQDARPAEILDEIAKQTGNKSFVLPEGWTGKPMTVHFDRTPYWQAIDQICKEQGLVIQPDRQTQGLGLAVAPNATEITCYSGPVVFKINTAMKLKNYRVSQSTDTLTYSLSYFWESRLDAAIVGPEKVEKVTDAGGALLQLLRVAEPGRVRIMQGQAVMAFLEDLPFGSFTVAVQQYPDDLRAIGEMSGEVTLALPEGRQELRVDDVLSEGPKSGEVFGWKLTVTGAERRRNAVNVRGTLTKDGKPESVMDFAGSEDYGVWLVDPDGKKYRGREVRARFLGVNPGGPRPPGPRDAQFDFVNVPEGAGILTLLYVFPEKLNQRAYPFKFINVPVP